jgi:hypothetical protein
VRVPFKPVTSGLPVCVADAANPPFAPGSFAWVHLGDVLDSVGDAAPPDEELLEALDGLGLHVVDQADRVPRVDRAYDRAFDVRFVHCIAATRA